MLLGGARTNAAAQILGNEFNMGSVSVERMNHAQMEFCVGLEIRDAPRNLVLQQDSARARLPLSLGGC